MGNLRLPDEGGSYLLWFYLSKQCSLSIGRFGDRSLKRGWYLYCGSALGPGGLRARLGHHLGKQERRHWHVDYLKRVAELRTIWFCRGDNNEHFWSRQLRALPDAGCPVEGFGSSDCRCPSHLVYFSRRPASRCTQEALAGRGKIERRHVLK